MQITTSQLQDFKNLYKSHFWQEIDDKTALTQATALLNIVKLLLSSNHKEEVWK
jgi:hypothetical protein